MCSQLTFLFIFFLIFASFSFSSSVRASIMKIIWSIGFKSFVLNKSSPTQLCISIHSPLASSRFKSLASTLLSRSTILVLGGLPGRRPPFGPRTLLCFSLSGFGGRPRRPVMAIIMEGTSSLAKSTHATPLKIKINKRVRWYNGKFIYRVPLTTPDQE